MNGGFGGISSGFGRSKTGNGSSLFFRFLELVLVDLPIALELGSWG